MRDEDRTEIRAALKYGTRAWRFLVLRKLLGHEKELPENYFSWLSAQHDLIERERQAIFRKYPTLEERRNALRKMRELPLPTLPLLHLWRAFIAQCERAFLNGDVDWWREVEDASRGDASPQDREQFIAKVIALLDYSCSPNVTASEIYDLLHEEKQSDGRLKVEGRIFENRQGAMDAIHDIAAEIGFTLARRRRRRATGLNARCDNGVICFPLLARKQSLK
jgi:hypothetical protein